MIKVKEKDSNVYGYGKGIIYVNGKYYMLSYDPAKVCVSEDLEEWTEYNLNINYLKPSNIAYGNGVFVITGDAGTTNSTYIYTSTNGTTWTPRVLKSGLTYSYHSNTCKFVNNRFITTISVGWSRGGETVRLENYFFESKNGINWTEHILNITSAPFTYTMDVAYGKGVYVRVGTDGSIYTSSNLDKWTKRNSGVKDKLVGVSFGKGQFVITGDKGIILTSKNGTNWTKQDSGTTNYLIRSKYANGMYIAIGYNGSILQSTDGVLWNNISKNTGVRYGLTYANERFVITGNTYNDDHTIPIFYFDVSRNLSADTEDSSLFFFDKNLNMLGIVDYFISLRWRRKYFEAGEFEIVLPVNEYTLNLVNKDVIVMRNNYTEAGIIETIEFSDDGTNEEMTISGRFLSSILERRIIKNTINFSGNSIEGMNTIVNAMTPFTSQWETVPAQMDSRSIEFQATYKNVYDYMCRLSEYSNIGFRVVPNVDSKVYMFEAWKGVDRTSEQKQNAQYTFSDDNFNIEQGSLILSSKTTANYILVAGEGENDDRVRVEVTEGKTGFDLYELFSDQKSLSSKDLTPSAYKNQLRDVGNSLICDGVSTFEVTATSIEDYKKKWNLGDIVNIKKEKWGQFTTQRIIEVEEVIEDGKKSIYPTFGSPLASAWQDK